MFTAGSTIAILVIFAAFTILAAIRKLSDIRFPLDGCVPYLWSFFFVLVVAELGRFEIAIWILAVLCFFALREYMSLIAIRLQDRWGVLGAYLAIPFMVYFIQIDWYGMFIISIPVYAFLAVPFLVTLGGRETEGTVFSIGAIDFGLFLLVYCVGHIGYLARYSTWMAAFLVLAVALGDLVAGLVPVPRPAYWTRAALRFALTAPLTVSLAWAVAPWTGIPPGHSVVLGLLIPALVAVGRRTMRPIEADPASRRARRNREADGSSTVSSRSCTPRPSCSTTSATT